MFGHIDQLHEIDRHIGLTSKLEIIHSAVRERFPFIVRIASAVYDPKTDQLTTFLHSSGGENPLAHYAAKLSETPSLKEIVERGQPRVINDLALFDDGTHVHTLRIGYQGYRASYTMPMYDQGELFGFLFFNAYETGCFTETVLQQLDPFGHVTALAIISELNALQTLVGTVRTAREMMHARDDETGSHLDRMARYARLIALAIADKYGLSDEYIEQIFIFAPLHDIGKIGIPDRVLLKPGKLDDAERALMMTHAQRGRELIDQMLGNFELGDTPHIDILRNIAELHHESVDGSGYPHGIRGADIPIEARIVAVADVFDALTSRRPYKPAWSIDEALAALQRLAGFKLDTDCVAALIEHRDKVEEIQAQFRESVD
jgi:HD-GYP domain-containing protein (c-di-GMP phosphodiesterase class II)